MDCIHLTNIRCYGYIGFLPEERVLGQWFEVDVKLWLDLTNASKNDTIEDTVDYRRTITLVQNLVKTSKFALIERLAGAIADAILEDSQSVTQIRVIVRKPAAPIPDFDGAVSVEVNRKRI
ncbi:dihydroneopterin aldolase family protein [Richelia sinica FACHB-800]|uniref:7,8-dihydroneopterin aldolase n=1 Tax=Richelia sinica FACHB-800 TaxID=1357546 RepID=A0A975T884_9NOST|nr:dihydroneopterin aldolase [Richelia sinica]MBD2667222.1 dihydroneopterin aldolase [Richelia sinica FACHB-800]QXE24018.1 dihydroneopterin aldolase family protein [Richelia sinica FACHB-800]